MYFFTFTARLLFENTLVATDKLEMTKGFHDSRNESWGMFSTRERMVERKYEKKWHQDIDLGEHMLSIDFRLPLATASVS